MKTLIHIILSTLRVLFFIVLSPLYLLHALLDALLPAKTGVTGSMAGVGAVVRALFRLPSAATNHSASR